MHFVDDIDFVFACGRRVLGVFQYLADIVDTGIGSGIDFQQIDVTSGVNLRTTFTYAARLAVFGMSAIKAFRQDTRNRGFAHPARAREQISMMQTAFVKCIAQSFDNVFLSDQIGKSFRPPFSSKHLISHNSSLDNDKFAPRPSENCVQKPAGTRILTFFSNAQYAACTAAILTVMNEQKMQQYLFWTIGGLDYRRWDHVLLGIGPIGIGASVMVLLARHLNLLAFGEVEARAAGMPVTAFRLLFLVLASLTTAAGVCISGNIGFVGLVVPHMMRLIVGPDHRRLLPASLLAGAVFLVLCDSVGRILLPGMEIRVGIMTAFIGTPYFLYLLRRHMQMDG